MAERGSLIDLTVDDLGVVQEELYGARTHWYNLGLKLRVKVDLLNSIRSQWSSPEERFREMLMGYLQTVTPSPSWRALAEALRSPTVDQPQLAEKVEQKYCPAPKLLETDDTSPPLPQKYDESLPNAQESAVPLLSLESKDPHPSLAQMPTESPPMPLSPVFENRPDTDELRKLALQISTSSEVSVDEEQQPKHFGCGCGKCSFHSFLEKGCPEPILSMSSFPYLNTNGLNHSQKQILRGKLYHEFEVITTDFGSLVYSTCESLIQQGVTVQQLVLLLRTLDAFQPTLPSQPLLEERIEELKSANSIYDVFFILCGYMSFFSYHIIDYIICKFGTQEDKKNLQNYTTKLDKYSRRSVFECPSYSPRRKDQANLVIKLEGVNLEKYTAKHLEVFQSRVSNIVKISKYTLRLCTVEKGCLQLTFQMSHFVKEVIFPLSESQKTALQDEGVTRLTCDNYQCLFKPSSSDLELDSGSSVNMDAEALLTEEPGTGEEEADFSMADLPRGDVTESLLEQGDCENIRAKTTAREKVDEFVTTIHTRECSKAEPAFDVFVEALKNQEVQAHIAPCLLRAFAKRKNEVEGQKGGEPESKARSALFGTVVQPPTPAVNENSPTESYEQHPEYSLLSREPPHRQDTPTAPPNKNLHLQYRLLPTPPPHSGTCSTSPHSGTDGEHSCDFELGMPPIFQQVCVQQLQPDVYSAPTESTVHDSPGQYGSISESSVTLGHGQSQDDFGDGIPNECVQAEAQLKQQMVDHMQLTREHTEEQPFGQRPRWSDRQLHEQLERKDAEIENLHATLGRLRRENSQLGRQYRDYHELQKELLDVKEKLKNVTLSYREHNYKTLQQSTSELNDYADLQEESGRLQKMATEQHSQLEVLQREKKQLKLQVAEYEHKNQQLKRDQEVLLSFSSSNPTLQYRPHHLPISMSLAVSQRSPLSHELPTVGDTPFGFTPLCSVHVGGHLSRHNIHLQQPTYAPLAEQRHSVSSGDDTVSVCSSDSSLSSHSSTISKTSIGLALSGPSTTTLE